MNIVTDIAERQRIRDGIERFYPDQVVTSFDVTQVRDAEDKTVYVVQNIHLISLKNLSSKSYATMLMSVIAPTGMIVSVNKQLELDFGKS
jgi:hypothetical protein